MGLKRHPCPGTGSVPTEITGGRCTCPTCKGDCYLTTKGLVGYHTSQFSKLRTQVHPAPPRAGLEQDLVDAMAWYSHEEGRSIYTSANQGRVWGFAIGRVGQIRALELLSFAGQVTVYRYISAGHLFMRYPEPSRR